MLERTIQYYPLLFTLIGIGVFIYALVIPLCFMKGVTEGKITTVSVIEPAGDEPYYRCTYSFQAGPSSYTGSFTSKSLYSEGDTVLLRYSMQNPEKNRAYDKTMTIACGVLSVFMVASGICGFKIASDL